MTYLDDLKMNLLNWPKAPYSCGSAEGWMEKAHDCIEELEAALREIIAIHDDFGPNTISGGLLRCREIARTALQPKAGS